MTTLFRRASPSCLAVLLGLCIVGPAHPASAAAAVSFQEIEESLTCQCGCGLTVHSCNHLQCPSAIPLREEVRSQMEAGKDKDAIIAFFSEKYGEKILSAPTTVGFNLVAWVTPFVLIGLGGVFVGITLMRWRRRKAPPPMAAPPAAAGAPPSPYSQVLERELKKFDA